MLHAPLRERDGALVDNWYIACLSSELRPGAPLPRILYDTPLALFRDGHGRAACVADRCLHRHAQLSKGTVKDGRIACPYHGWIYDARGRVVEVPSEGCARRGASLSEDGHSRGGRSGASLRTFPTVEQDGAVWVWMGEGEPTSKQPPWRFPYAQEKGWHSYFMITDFDNEVTHLAENFMDVPHTVFVHAGWFRNQARMRVPIRVETGEGRVLVTYAQANDSIGFTKRMINPTGEPMVHTDLFVMPNVTRVDYGFGGRNGVVISSQMSPVSTLRTRVYTWIAYRLGSFGPVAKLVKPFMRFYTRQVIEQDVDIMANQGANLARDMSCRFHHTDADEVHRAIERLRSLGAQGDARWRTIEGQVEKEIHI